MNPPQFLLRFISYRESHPLTLGKRVKGKDLYLFKWAKGGNLNLSWNQIQILKNYVLFFPSQSVRLMLSLNHELFFSFVDK